MKGVPPLSSEVLLRGGIETKKKGGGEEEHVWFKTIHYLRERRSERKKARPTEKGEMCSTV